jgi:hypothetical protein
MSYFQRKRASVHQLMVVQTRERASRHVADHIAACTLGREADGGQSIDDLRQRLDGEPVELNVLPRGDVSQVSCVLLRQFCDDAELIAGQHAVGHANPHHEVLARFALARGASGHAKTVALRVNAPPLEVKAGPLRQHRVAALLRELAHFVPRVPGILGEFQPFRLLGLGLFDRLVRGHDCFRGCIGHADPLNVYRYAENRKAHRVCGLLGLCSGSD